MNDARTLRLVWPQWQGAGRDNVAQLMPEVSLTRARRGYVVGARVLQAILPEHAGPTEIVPVAMDGHSWMGCRLSRAPELADVFPDFGGVGGVNDLRAAIGALLTFVLVLII